MAKFRFRLETLLRLKVAARDQCRAQLAEVLQAEQQLQEQQAQIREEIEAQHEYLRKTTASGGLNVDLLAAAQREVMYLKGLGQQKQQLMQQLVPHIQQRRQALIDADHEVRTLEKLKQHKWEQHNKSEAAREAKQMDEIAMNVFLRKGD